MRLALVTLLALTLVGPASASSAEPPRDTDYGPAVEGTAVSDNSANSAKAGISIGLPTALVGSSATPAGPPDDTDYLLAGGTFLWPGYGTKPYGVSVTAWIDPRRDFVPGSWSIDVPPENGTDVEGWVGCLNVQGHEAAVVGAISWGGSFKFVFRDNGREPDELVSLQFIFPGLGNCDFVPGQPAQFVFDGDVNIHDAPPFPPPPPPQRYTIVTSGSLSNPNGLQSHGSVNCPSGTVAWSGGVSGDSTSLLQNINSSYPTVSNGNAIGWAANVNNASGADSSFAVYAVCARRPSGLNYAVVSATFPADPDSESGGDVLCPVNGGKQLLAMGGGAFGFSGSLGQNINKSVPNPSHGWQVDILSDVTSNFTVYAVCAKRSGYMIKTGFSYNPAHSQSVAIASCPPGANVIGGGAWPQSEWGTPVYLNSTYPNSPTSWSISVNNADSVLNTIYAYAICTF